MKSIHFPPPASDDMVRAILDNRKTVMRRAVKGYALDHLELDTDGSIIGVYSQDEGHVFPVMDYAPYHPGDILYVRETWRVQSARRFDADARIMFKAGGDMARIQFPGGGTQYHSRTQYDAFVHKWADDRWRPSIHMPREAARIFLRVTDVRVERLRESFFQCGPTIIHLQKEGVDIGEQCRECIEAYGSPCCIDSESECGMLDEVRSSFSDLWDSTIRPGIRALYGWGGNPWVRVIEFERCEKPEGA